MFKPGIEVFFEENHSLKPVSVAAVTNFTGRDRSGKHLISYLAESSCFNLKKIFTPEHGFTSDAPDGEHVPNSHCNEIGIEIISLYGTMKKPSPEALKGIDILIYDIQDLGVRFYTYISTLRNILDVANECNIKVIILDRPDILGGKVIEGPNLDIEFSSFVGHLPVPLRYGLTPGELANWWHNKNKYTNELVVCKCQNYCCPIEFDKLEFPWFKPSPSMPNAKTALLYPGTCLFEGTNISEGRGTEFPFRNLGAPFIDSKKWIECIKSLLTPEVQVKTTIFTPTFSKYENQKCHGIKISCESIINNSVFIGIAAMWSLMQTHYGQIEFTGRPRLKYPFIDYLAGTDQIRKGLLANEKPSDIIRTTSSSVCEFTKEREAFFLYPRA